MGWRVVDAERVVESQAAMFGKAMMTSRDSERQRLEWQKRLRHSPQNPNQMRRPDLRTRAAARHARSGACRKSRTLLLPSFAVSGLPTAMRDPPPARVAKGVIG